MHAEDEENSRRWSGACVSANIRKFYEQYAIPADSFARAVAFAIGQPEGVDVNEILFRPTRQELQERITKEAP